MGIIKLTSCLTLLVTLSITTAISAPGPTPGGTLNVGSWNEPRSLSPTSMASDSQGDEVGGNVYDDLVRYDVPSSTFVPELATEWRIESPTSWVFKLRQGVQFQKGYGEMTANDVAFMINYIIDNHRPSQSYYNFVTKVDVVDRYTVRVTLQQPYSPLLAIMASGQGGFVISQKAFQEKGETAYARSPVGTGPFYVDSWTAGDRIVLRRSDNYWRKGRPLLDGFIWRVVPDEIARENLLLAGEVDFDDLPVFQHLPKLLTNDKVVVDRVPGWNWDYMTFDAAKTPFNMQAVRQAISYALDREAINQLIYYGLGHPTDTMLAPGFPCAAGAVQRYPYKGDPERARALLKSAGLPEGFDAEVITGAKDNLRRELQVITNQLQRVGIRLHIAQLDEATYTARVRGHSDFQAEMDDISAIGPDPDAFLFQFYDSIGVRMHHHSSAATDATLAQGRALPVGPERCQLYTKLANQLVDQAYYVYIVNAPRVRVYSTRVKGYYNHPMDIFMRFDNVWLSH
jgi:peptide/nickel transport system substrate-binding protein